MLSTHIYGSVRMTVFIHVTNEDKQKNTIYQYLVLVIKCREKISC